MPTQARARVTWNSILDAAAQVLVAEGYARATTDRIAERAGVSVGSVYEYFPKKEAIFASLLLRWNEERWKVFSDARNNNDVDGLESSIRNTVRARILATRINPALNTALRRELPASVTEEQARQIHDEFLETAVATLAPYAPAGRDPRLMAELMTHATHAVIEGLAASNPDLLASSDLEDELTLMMVSYLKC